MEKKYTIVAVGTGDPGKMPVWVAYVKTYMEKASSLKGRVDMPLVFPSIPKSFDGIMPSIVAHNPDMVTFTPHEDWDNKQLLDLCVELKAWNKDVTVVICAENPRNRMQVEAAVETGAVDYIIHGEAEIPLEKIVEADITGTDLPRMDNLLCLSAAKQTAGL